MTRFTLPLFVLTLAAGLAAQSGWRLVETTDDLTATRDRRLILRADDWPAPSAGAAAEQYRGATLVVACGHRLPSAGGRSLVFYADQPMQPFGDLAYVELKFDAQPPVKAFYTILEYGDGLDARAGRRFTRYIAFLGTEQSPYFSPQVFAKLVAAARLTVTYRAFGADRTVSFRVAGLREALPQLSECRWTEERP